MNEVYIIEYSGYAISSEGYKKIEDAFDRLEYQGYKQIMGWFFENDAKDTAKIYGIKIK